MSRIRKFHFSSDSSSDQNWKCKHKHQPITQLILNPFTQDLEWQPSAILNEESLAFLRSVHSDSDSNSGSNSTSASVSSVASVNQALGSSSRGFINILKRQVKGTV